MGGISYYLEPIVKKWVNPGPKTKIISCISICILFVLSYLIINFAGSQSYLHLHLLYLTIIIAALIFKLPGGVVAGSIGGLILGPLMSWQMTGSIYNLNNWLGRAFLAIIVGFFSGIILDILSEKINQLAQQGYYNQITELPNRQNLHMKLDRIINLKKGNNKRFVLLVISIENFADIFNMIGYQQSDSFLRKVKQYLLKHLNENGELYHAHNNKFNILLLNHDKSTALKRAKEYSSFLQEPVLFNGIPIYLKTSIGLAAYPEHSQTGEEIINKAYIAMDKARSNSLDYRWYHKNLDKKSKHNFLLLGDVKKALREDEFELHYQPKINSVENEVIGLKALIRWDYPGRGYIPPNQFIPQVEQTGLINHLTIWVLEQAIKDWRKMKKDSYEVKISINISARDLQDPDFVGNIKEILKKYDINPSFLEFEITERDIMNRFSQTKEVLNQIVKLGIDISLDDFGTGHSSLAYLKYLPTKSIKIDRAFIKDILIDDKDKAITEAAIKMAHSLDKTVVAEGVENQQSIDLLRGMDCDIVQGYYISKPKPLSEIKKWFETEEFKV
ncbi:putative bifunctional diguanylate cyclase/phosphodiesterase [Halanaerobacter jeridensis]|uniref:Diguanylate cyclase (GGDEF)-like protein n=1 Tax=Halanaerobacter jeridensis TaxID=706427 RepID=A0A938XNH2_9FIRM|nr:bifunctional diguanylate cyclase/phosphodiesterase [Halanaerobacter jeridensis]MBM7555432.1 diguanylate cyclase (GGDEF)-like protein [Halanaerobacter jeridensis]